MSLDVTFPLQPGAVLGMLGGGQLGRMFALAAAEMGYQVWVYDPNQVSPAGEVAYRHIQAAYDDKTALAEFGQACAVVTTEFENIPAETLRYLESYCRVCPNPNAVHIAQNRIREKTFVNDLGIPTSAFKAINNLQDIEAASDLNFPCILKTAEFGYDGKGQVIVEDLTAASKAFSEMDGVACILEEKIQLESEISVVLGRNQQGEISFFPVARNVHKNGILHISSVPAEVTDELQTYACELAQRIAEKLDYVGIMAVEYFIDQEQRLLVNEIAPRVHNSGHYSQDACSISQFEQQVRVLSGWTPADTRYHTPVAMVNILGDAWRDGQLPTEAIYNNVNIKVHIYGKAGAKPGRKMGHFNVLAESVTDAIKLGEVAYQQMMNPQA